MLSYLEKYNQLDAALKDAVTAPAAMAAVGELEKTFGVSLAIVIIRVMVKDISIVDLPKYFVFEHNLDGAQADALTDALKARVFAPVAGHLGFIVDSAARDEAQLEDWLTARQDETAIRGSSFFFSPEDEEEVRALAKSASVDHVAVAKKQAQGEQELKAMVDQVAAKMRINFSSAELAGRYWHIVETYVRGVRNRIETKQSLMKDVDAGGVALNTDFSNRTIALADSLKAESLSAGAKPLAGGLPAAADAGAATAPVPPAGKPAPGTALGAARDVAYDFNALAKRPVPSRPTPPPIRSSVASVPPAAPPPVRPRSDEPVIDLKADAPASVGSSPGSLVPPPVPPPAPSRVVPPPPPPRPGVAAGPALSTLPPLDLGKVMQAARTDARPALTPGDIAPPSGKVRVADVTHVPKLMGPIDELRDMDLITFRRLGTDAASAANRIREKIAFLEEDTYAKRLEGIKAWRESPINKLYLALGGAGIGQGKSIDAILEERIASGEDTLSRDEFTAIMNLNRELRF